MNGSLSDCNVQGICEYLTSPNGIVQIYGNGSGCSNPGEIARSCGFKMPCLPFGHYYFMKQSDVDSFLSYYQDCDHLEGSVIIGWHPIEGTPEVYNFFIGEETGIEAAVTSLSGLREITSIAGNLAIRGDHKLTDLRGLEKLVTIGGNLAMSGWFHNKYLTSLTGLDNLESIGGGLFIAGNTKLNSLTGLKNLKSLGGELAIGGEFMGWHGNDSLMSLKGLENVDTATIQDLKIVYNMSLSDCDVANLCNYLSAPGGSIEIHDNGTGCSSREEIEEACITLSTPEIDFTSEYSIYPNPALSEITVISRNDLDIETINIFNQLGQKLLAIDHLSNPIDLSNLQRGTYILEIISNEFNHKQRLLIL